MDLKTLISILVLVCLGACSSEKVPTSDGHQRMVAILDSLIMTINPQVNQFANSARVEYYRNRPPDPKPSRRINQKAVLASELLNSGSSEEAAQLFQEVLDDLDQLKIDNPQYANTIKSMMGISWLRVAEQDNCLKNHNDASCIYPIIDKGVHHLPKGANAAIEIYSAMVDENPNDLESKWLLNICYMILGMYPDQVPAKYKLPTSIFSENIEIEPFNNVAEKVGLDHVALSGGSIMEDFNGDGWLDIMCTSWGLGDQAMVFLNDGNGKFYDYTNESGLQGISGGLNAKAGDYNNDGIVDVFITRGGWREMAGELPNSLLHGNGDGTFKDVTIEMGVLSFRPTQTMTWNDFNGDGWLDIFVGNESNDIQRHPCELFLNNGDGTFREVADQALANKLGFVKGVISDDFDGDGRQDIFISKHGEPNFLLRNRRSNNAIGFVFDDWSRKSGISEPIQSFPTWNWDYDNDGDQDIFVATYDMQEGDNLRELMNMPTTSDKCKLYKNRGDGTFEDITEEAGINKVMLAMGSNIGDINSDGWLDMYIGTGHPDYRSLMPNRVFINMKGQAFEEATNSSRLGHLQKGHGVSFGDIDHDGDEDVFAVIGGAFEGDVFQNAMFVNPMSAPHFINLKLVGIQSNKLSIGAKIIFHLEDGNKLYRTINTGGSFGSSPFEVNLSLISDLKSVEVKWPQSPNSITYQLPMDQSYVLIEGSSDFKLIQRTEIIL